MLYNSEFNYLSAKAKVMETEFPRVSGCLFLSAYMVALWLIQIVVKRAGNIKHMESLTFLTLKREPFFTAGIIKQRHKTHEVT